MSAEVREARFTRSSNFRGSFFLIFALATSVRSTYPSIFFILSYFILTLLHQYVFSAEQLISIYTDTWA